MPQFLRAAWRPVIHATSGLTHLLFPAHCASCEIELPPPADECWLCDPCRAILADRDEVRCPYCAAKVVRLVAGENCPLCHAADLRFETVFPLGSYRGRLRGIVLRMKHSLEEPLSAAMAELLWLTKGPAIKDWRPDLVIPVPMHWWRRWRHGTNSSEIVAECLAARIRAPYKPGLLARTRNTRQQSGLPPGVRIENVRNAFRVKKQHLLQGARVLLVDDVLTTGATCSEIARLLHRSGVDRVAVAVVGRAQGAS